MGVKVTIVTWHPDAYKYGRDDVRMELMEKLRKAGFEIRLVEGSCEHFAVIDNFGVFDDVRNTYFAISDAELRYRGNESTTAKALEDTIQAAVCIGSKGKTSADDFSSYLQGMRDIVNHIYERGFNMEVASTMAPKVIYMAACLLTKTSFEKHFDIESLKAENLTQKDLLTMKAFRKTRIEDYVYLVLADRLLRDYR